MRFFSILLLLTLFSKTSVGQTNEIDTFFSQFDNGFYKDLTKAKFFIVDSVVDLSYMNFKDLYSIDTSLSTNDINFLSNNIKEKTRLIWTNKTFDSAIIKSKKKLESIVRKTSTKTSSIAYFELSLPYFNKTKDACFIYCSFYCGRRCYEGCYRLYKKINGYWMLVNKYGCVVS